MDDYDTLACIVKFNDVQASIDNDDDDNVHNQNEDIVDLSIKGSRLM